MGMALGKITVETPNHVVVHKTDNYQIWRYPPTLAATVHAKDLELSETPTEREFTSAAFRTLARYIGVFGTPQNHLPNPASDADPHSDTHAHTPLPEPIAMTAPVEMKPHQIAMTAPVEMKPSQGVKPSSAKDMSMSFLLPAKYSNIDDAPVPTNPAVNVVEVPSRYHAVVQYSGNLAMATSYEHAEKLMLQLGTDSVKVVGEWMYCGYNPPITLPWLKRNEIHVPVDASQFDNVTQNVE